MIPVIFEYIDYRLFLKDYYAVNKNSKSYFSYRFFARRAGIKNPVFLKLVIDGERNLSANAIESFCKAIEFNEKEATYFRHLAGFNQARTSAEKQEHYAVLRSFAHLIPEQKLTADSYDFYSQWYTSVIRELICLYNFNDNIEKIAASISPRISVKEAKEAMSLLLRLGLVKKQENGKYTQTHKAITTGNEITSLAIRNFNRQMAGLAADALEHYAKEIRHISGITMGISQGCYQVLTSEIEAFKERVIQIVNSDEQSDKVYQLNVQLFPLSKDMNPKTDGPEEKTVKASV